MNTLLFTTARIGALALPNRLVRSASAARMADTSGRPRPEVLELYRQLARGGVGLIISGHMYIVPEGKCHAEMTGVYTDDLIPNLAALAGAVHQEGGRIIAQINHGGMQCSREVVAEAVAPSAVEAAFLHRTPRAMTLAEIDAVIADFGQAARRVQEAGFDGVQLHGAHGYLISQFLSPFSNRRSDGWGGDLEGRMRFLRAACTAVREAVGPDYPLLIKLGMMDGMEGGLTTVEGVRVVAALEGMGIDGVEISGGIAGGRDLNSPGGVRSEADEAFFRPLARQAREGTKLPILLVGGLRSRRVMEDVLASGDADFISLCRPLICEPDLPRRLQQGQARAVCISGNRCWPDGADEGIACKCKLKEDE